MSHFLQQHRVYQDDDILVINKPAGLLSVPGKGEHLFDSVLSRLQQLEPRTLLIHRLDRDTSGLLIFALNKAAQTHISKQFQARETEKIYLALVSGHVTGNGSIDIPVVYDPTRPPLHMVDPHEKKSAITHWQALSCDHIHGQPITRVQLQPITGRAHQLRVHLQYLGHPIVGDTLYANNLYQSLTPHLCLHATQLKITHPRTQKMINFECPPNF